MQSCCYLSGHENIFFKLYKYFSRKINKQETCDAKNGDILNKLLQDKNFQFLVRAFFCF